MPHCRTKRALGIFLLTGRLICRAALSRGIGEPWAAVGRIETAARVEKRELAGAALAPTFPDQRSAMFAGRSAGRGGHAMEAIHAEAQRQLDSA
ncbi:MULTISPECIES: hypothetical protein [unclassified Xanthomonas]|uniref:hypothetical protein n=1 Tax=unclassified Xanthomonas TaxID=2643310 RepID=UPI002B236439|nr:MULTISPECIES: hypothetical protein [unclassified Xanthomonas]MEA9562872.1 hypothetical protein [Xanthomonas sp. WHRI 8932A]MEA9633925.1 hypothetical protein [Xanthomonas sp. WHRI 8812E]